LERSKPAEQQQTTTATARTEMLMRGGDTLPLDAHCDTGLDKIGFTLRHPAGSWWPSPPFNYPALLVLHKLAPALAAGNAVVLKPARTTPLTALELAACFMDAGLPEGAVGPHRAGRHPRRRAGRRPARAQDLLHRLDRHRRAPGRIGNACAKRTLY
jgi:acyl-CoA reductase-like NAD-dependent aldehyde dehydrogenase